ncbi:MAG: translation initiation factor IF-2 subunit gamma [Candidatus Nezhaarchaeota archaeon]|nr:translation initiation factor IF-2 subunit gamma [Candidatus Nezhaarchaeota archaeon]
MASAQAQAAASQSLLNIGTTGHVDHGKTTLVWSLSGVWAAKHSEELRRGITLRLGYSDVVSLKCPQCPPPQCYTTPHLAGGWRCKFCGSPLQFLRKFSFVDCPGHEMLMATMLAGATLMDGALLVIDATAPCPQPQTREHLKALEIIGIDKIVIVQNKVDVVPREKVLENYRQILDFIKGTPAEGAPIIPVSALHSINMDALLQAIDEVIPTPARDEKKPVRLLIARSFDVNKPGTPPEDLKGGVLGGSIVQGILRVGDEVEIRPGLRIEGPGGKVEYEPIFTEVVSLRGGDVELEEARPGGLIGVGTLLDPSLTKADALVGSVLGRPGLLPEVLWELELETHLLERAIGTIEQVKVEKIKPNEPLLLNVGTATTSGIARPMSSDRVSVKLKRPVCVERGRRVAISRQIGGRFRLIGYGVVR